MQAKQRDKLILYKQRGNRDNFQIFNILFNGSEESDHSKFCFVAISTRKNSLLLCSFTIVFIYIKGVHRQFAIVVPTGIARQNSIVKLVIQIHWFRMLIMSTEYTMSINIGQRQCKRLTRIYMALYQTGRVSKLLKNPD